MHRFFFFLFYLVSLINETRPISYHLNQFKIHELISKRYKLACAPIKDTYQTAYPRSLSRVFDGCSMGRQGSNVSSDGKLSL